MTDQPVRLVISAGGRTLTGEDLGPLPENVTVHEFLESRAVLGGASVHITHGGCNSVHESLVAGVPMVCLPQAFDQIPLSARVAELRAGVVAAENAERRSCARCWTARATIGARVAHRGISERLSAV